MKGDASDKTKTNCSWDILPWRKIKKHLQIQYQSRSQEGKSALAGCHAPKPAPGTLQHGERAATQSAGGISAGTAALPEASPSPLSVLRAAGRRDAARKARGRSQHSAISCAGEHQAPVPTGLHTGYLGPFFGAFFIGCSLSHSQQEERVCRGLTHSKSPAQGAQTGACPIERDALTGHGTPRTSCTHRPRKIKYSCSS